MSSRPIVVSLLLIWLAAQLFPVFFLLSTSLKTESSILNSPFSLPAPVTFDNFIGVLREARGRPSFTVYLQNSLIVTSLALVLLIGMSALAGYALARINLPGSPLLQNFFLFAMAIPVQTLIVPTYLMFGEIGWKNNLAAMALLYAAQGVPFTTILMRSYFVSFPRELEEAALLDGCSRLGAFVRVVLPVSSGALASMAIVNVSWIWSELFFGQVLLDRSSLALFRPPWPTFNRTTEELQAASANFSQRCS